MIKKFKVAVFLISIAMSMLIYIYLSTDFVKFDYMFHCTYDSEQYIKKINQQNLNLYYPTWILFENKDDLFNNDIGIELSEMGLSNINFETNNIIIFLGAKIKIIQYFDNGLTVNVLGLPTNYNDIYVYKIPKVHIKRNELMRPSGMFYSIFEYIF